MCNPNPTKPFKSQKGRETAVPSNGYKETKDTHTDQSKKLIGDASAKKQKKILHAEVGYVKKVVGRLEQQVPALALLIGEVVKALPEGTQ